MTVQELIEKLNSFDQSLPVQIGADGVAWEITSGNSVFLQEIDGKETVVIWDGYWD